MLEVYNPKTGTLEVDCDFKLPTLTNQERAAATELFEVSKLTGDPVRFIKAEQRKVQDWVLALRKKNLNLRNPGILINFSEEDLSVDALLKVMDCRRLLCGDRSDQETFINTLKKRQSLPTGGVLLMDRALQTVVGLPQSGMEGRTSLLDEKIVRAASHLGVVQLGIVPSLQLYNQSSEVRLEMLSKRQVQFTPDVTADGGIACLDNWLSSDGKVDTISLSECDKDKDYGCRAAVVQK